MKQQQRFFLSVSLAIFAILICGCRRPNNPPYKTVFYVNQNACISSEFSGCYPLYIIPEGYKSFGDRIKIYCRPELEKQTEKPLQFIQEVFDDIAKYYYVNLLKYLEPRIVVFDLDDPPLWLKGIEEPEKHPMQWRLYKKNGKTIFTVPVYYSAKSGDDLFDNIVCENTKIEILMHEMTHVYLWEKGSDPNLQCSWFEEGLCDFVGLLYREKRLMAESEQKKKYIGDSSIRYYMDEDIDLFAWEDWGDKSSFINALNSLEGDDKKGSLYAAACGLFLSTPSRGKTKDFIKEAINYSRRRKTTGKEISAIYKRVFGVSPQEHRKRLFLLPGSVEVGKALKDKKTDCVFCLDNREFNPEKIDDKFVASFDCDEHYFSSSFQPLLHDTFLIIGLREKSKANIFYAASEEEKQGYIGRTNYAENKFTLEEMPYNDVMKIYELSKKVNSD